MARLAATPALAPARRCPRAAQRAAALAALAVLLAGWATGPGRGAFALPPPAATASGRLLRASPPAPPRSARGRAARAPRAALLFAEAPASAALVLLAGLAGGALFAKDAVGGSGGDEALRELIEEHTNVQIIDAKDVPPGGLGTGPEEALSNIVPSASTSEEVHWYCVDDDKLPPVKLVLKSDRVFERMLTQGGVGFGESYMDGEWETDNLERMIWEMLKLTVLVEQRSLDLGWRALPLLGSLTWGALKWKLFPNNSKTGAKENIENTYDTLDNPKLYEKMLGETMQYTCGYFYKPSMTLDEAEWAKIDLIATKLDLKPGMRVCEIGFGFGVTAHYLASKYGVHVSGFTLSEDQRAWAMEHKSHPNIEYNICDYRDIEGKFDRIYSCGMFEHVGRNNYGAYFDKCYELLNDDGIMLIHTMGSALRADWNHGSFINKYIFPGVELPRISDLTQEYSDRWHLEDLHCFGKGYVQTCRGWLDNLRDWKGLEDTPASERRMWEYYLAAGAAAFERRRCQLWQVVYTKLDSPRRDGCYHIRAPQEA